MGRIFVSSGCPLGVFVFNYPSDPLRVSGETDAGELPAGVGGEEVAVGGTDVGLGCGAGAAAQDHLVAHELGVVLAQGALEWAEAGIGRVGAAGPLPDIAEELLDRCRC